MSNKDTGNNENKPPHDSVPPINTGDIQDNQGINKPHNGRKPKEKSKPKPHIFKRVVTIIGSNKNQAHITNIIYFATLIVSAFLAYYTYRVFNQTTEQTKQATIAADAAKKSADAAKLSADLQSQAFEMQKKVQANSDASDKIKEKRANNLYRLQKTNDSTQIAALKESQKEFETSHSPFITVEDFSIAGNFLVINIENEGTQVAYILAVKTAIRADRADKIRKNIDTIEANKFLPWGERASSIRLIAPNKDFSLNIPISDTDLRDVNLRKKIFYIRVRVYYFNITKEKYMMYESMYRWDPTSGGMATIYFGYDVIKKFP